MYLLDPYWIRNVDERPPKRRVAADSGLLRGLRYDLSSSWCGVGFPRIRRTSGGFCADREPTLRSRTLPPCLVLGRVSLAIGQRSVSSECADSPDPARAGAGRGAGTGVEAAADCSGQDVLVGAGGARRSGGRAAVAGLRTASRGRWAPEGPACGTGGHPNDSRLATSSAKVTSRAGGPSSSMRSSRSPPAGPGESHSASSCENVDHPHQASSERLGESGERCLFLGQISTAWRSVWGDLHGEDLAESAAGSPAEVRVCARTGARRVEQAQRVVAAIGPAASISNSPMRPRGP